MARPKKQTVDYFPHYCTGGKSLHILQTQYGNDGYAFWFKLLQLLGKTEGHYYDYNNQDSWLFLLAETHVPDEKAEQIIETLASIGSIDKELYEKKIIWSQNFVDNVSDVYLRRKTGIPQRPGSIPVKIKVETDDLKVAAMIDYYEQNLGRTLSNNDLDNLKSFADTYPDGWFERAVDEAKNGKNVRSPMRYIEKILEEWTKAEQPVKESRDNQGFKVI
jgi:DnaD/phage-associated family protein